MSLNRSIFLSQEDEELKIDLALLEAQREVNESQNRYDFNEVARDLRKKLITKLGATV